jgi:tryptophan synthase beta subunit
MRPSASRYRWKCRRRLLERVIGHATDVAAVGAHHKNVASALAAALVHGHFVLEAATRTCERTNLRRTTGPDVSGVQNDLAKDAVREAINAALDAFFGSALRGELQKVAVKTCGSRKK